MENKVTKTSTKSRRPSYKRKQYIINSAFQWRYAVTVTLSVFMLATVMSSVLYVVLHQQARMRVIDPEHYTANVAFLICLAGACFALVTAAGLGLWSIMVTHRICGPIYVMQRFLEEVAAGRLPKLRPLRKKDEFKELYSVFCNVIDSLKKRKERQAEQLNQALSALENAANDGGTSLEAVRSQLEAMRGEIATVLGHQVDITPPDANASTDKSAMEAVAVGP